MKSKNNHAIEAEIGSEGENAERIRKMELILSKAMEYADKLIHHRSQAKYLNENNICVLNVKIPWCNVFGNIV